MWTLIAVLLKANYSVFFFSFEVDCSKTFLTRPKLAQYVKRRSALSSVDDLFIGISKSGNHAFVFFANPFASLTAFSGCKSQNMFSYLMTYLPNNTVAQYHQIITANCYNYA